MLTMLGVVARRAFLANPHKIRCDSFNIKYNIFVCVYKPTYTLVKSYVLSLRCLTYRIQSRHAYTESGCNSFANEDLAGD